MTRKKKIEGAQPDTCPECKESAEGALKLVISYGCDKHGRTKLGVREMAQNQTAFVQLLNWYIDTAGADIFMDVQRLAREGNQRAIDILKVTGRAA